MTKVNEPSSPTTCGPTFFSRSRTASHGKPEGSDDDVVEGSTETKVALPQQLGRGGGGGGDRHRWFLMATCQRRQGAVAEQLGLLAVTLGGRRCGL